MNLLKNTHFNFTMSLAALAGGAARQSDVFDNRKTLYLDLGVRLRIALTPGSTWGHKAIVIYAFGADGEPYPDGAGAYDAAIELRVPSTFQLLGIISAPEGGTSYTWRTSPFEGIAGRFQGILPRYTGIVVANLTGLPFNPRESEHEKEFIASHY